jgi:hypothetical protein
MGPFTHIVTNVLNSIEPTSYNDALALRHDVEYLRSGERFYSDWKAIKESDWTPQGIMMKLGLAGRITGDIITHLLPFSPKLHLNGSELTEKQIELIQDKASKLLMKWGIKPDFC